MIEAEKLIVCLGVNSGLAQLVMPEIKMRYSEVLGLTTGENTPSWLEKTKLLAWQKGISLNPILLEGFMPHFVDLVGDKEITFINFAGSIGSANGFWDLDSKSIAGTIMSNLEPFLDLSAIVREISNRTLILSFSGAGLGGDSVDDASMGYLGAKAVLYYYTEVFHNHLSSEGKFFSLIAPGHFPTKIHTKVVESNSPYISQKRRDLATNFHDFEIRKQNLIGTIFFAIENPGLVSGRLISAQWDDKKAHIKDNIGKIRRIF